MGIGIAALIVMQPMQQFLCMFAKLQKVTVSFIMSVHPHVTTWLPLDRVLWNFMLEAFYYNLFRKSIFGQNWTWISGTLRKDIGTVFYALLTVHPSIIFVNKPTWCTNFSCIFISVLCVFQATMCPSSGELTVSI